MSNTLIVGNKANFGGALNLRNEEPRVNTGATVTFLNTTVSDNIATFLGPSFYNDTNTHISIINSIVMDEIVARKTDGSPASTSYGTIDYNYSYVAGINPTDGAGNLGGTDPANTPLFVDRANGDYRAESNSPSIDVGSNQAYWDFFNVALFTGNEAGWYGERLNGSSIDMGATEFYPPENDPTPDGNGIVYVTEWGSGIKVRSSGIYSYHITVLV
ncbi:hypothetical protein FACS1894199_18440 [Bacteroidia bacterium]|nr:hypothetical protein FACS1894199_18440 [Bacteroidia bacterium]